MAKSETSGCTWLIAILFIGGMAVFCCGGLGKREGGNGDHVPQSRSLVVSTGEIGELRTSVNGDVILAVDVSAFDRMIQLSVAGDNRGLAQLALAGRAFLVRSGTKARVIGRAKLGVAEVRIEDGDMMGRSGFVAAEFIQNEKTQPSVAAQTNDTGSVINVADQRTASGDHERDGTAIKLVREAAVNALTKYFSGNVNVTQSPTVIILDPDTTWAARGRYDSPIDQRHEFQAIVRLFSTGNYETINLALDSDVVVDGVSAERAARLVPESSPHAETGSDPAEGRQPLKHDAVFRVWASADGKFSVNAEFLSYGEGKVKLKKEDGAVITVEVKNLSEQDQQWIRERRKSASKPQSGGALSQPGGNF